MRQCTRWDRERERESRQEIEWRGRAASRNNVTQLKIQYADDVVYQMEIHTRISLSTNITMVFMDREKEYAK